MIRRPPKRIGGAIGLEFDALWEALGQQTITDSASVQVDRTTRGTVIRTRPSAAEGIGGAYFRVTSSGSGQQFGAVVKGADGTPLPSIGAGVWGTGNKMISSCSRLSPLGLERVPVFDSENHTLIWALEIEGSPITAPLSGVGSIVFAVKTELEYNFEGHDTQGNPIYAREIFWQVVPTSAAPAPPVQYTNPEIQSIDVSGHSLPLFGGTVGSGGAQFNTRDTVTITLTLKNFAGNTAPYLGAGVEAVNRQGIATTLASVLAVNAASNTISASLKLSDFNMFYPAPDGTENDDAVDNVSVMVSVNQTDAPPISANIVIPCSWNY